jgi:hypothetical protein
VCVCVCVFVFVFVCRVPVARLDVLDLSQPLAENFLVGCLPSMLVAISGPECSCQVHTASCKSGAMSSQADGSQIRCEWCDQPSVTCHSVMVNDMEASICLRCYAEHRRQARSSQLRCEWCDRPCVRLHSVMMANGEDGVCLLCYCQHMLAPTTFTVTVHNNPADPIAFTVTENQNPADSDAVMDNQNQADSDAVNENPNQADSETVNANPNQADSDTVIENQDTADVVTFAITAFPASY